MQIIDRNMSGDDPSVRMKLSSKLPLLYPSSYWAITGMTGTGKTSLTDQLFILDLIENRKSIRWVYHVMERNKIQKYAKWVSYLIYQKEGIILDFNTIVQNRKKSRALLTDEYELIKTYDDFLQREVLPRIDIYTGPADKEEIRRNITKAYNRKDFDMLIHISDHAGKVKGKGDSYTTIRDYSNSMGEMRDKLGIIHVDVVQLNQKRVNDTHRRRNFGAEILSSDVYGGEIIPQNVDVMLGILHPNAMNLDSRRGYDMKQFAVGDDNRYREVKVMKANFDTLQTVPCLFIGETAKFIEIPNASDINYDQMKEQYL